MATKYQINHGGQRPLAFLTDTARVHLVTPNGSVTSKFSVALRFQATYGPLLQYIEDRQGWTPQVTRTINWKAHSASLKKRVQHRTHYIKLIHGILPTGKQMFRKDPVRSLCSACKTQCEDWSLILICSATSRENWRNETLDAVDATCRRLGTRPLLRRVLLAGLDGWLKSGESFILNPHQFPPAMSRLIRQQNEAGWCQTFLGRFCLEWSDIQDDYYARERDSQKPNKLTGNRWQVAVIGELWDQWKLLWKLRNQDLHGETKTQQSTAEHRNIHRDLRELYDARAHMEPSVQALMMADVTEHLSKPNWFNKNWLAIHAPLVKASIKRARDKAIRGVRSIRQYFSNV